MHIMLKCKFTGYQRHQKEDWSVCLSSGLSLPRDTEISVLYIFNSVNDKPTLLPLLKTICNPILSLLRVSFRVNSLL